MCNANIPSPLPIGQLVGRKTKHRTQRFHSNNFPPAPVEDSTSRGEKDWSRRMGKIERLCDDPRNRGGQRCRNCHLFNEESEKAGRGGRLTIQMQSL